MILYILSKFTALATSVEDLQTSSMSTSTFRRIRRQRFSVRNLICISRLLLCFPIVMAESDEPVQMCESKECLRSAANLALSMDTTADPCDDFYQFSCGNWGKEHPRLRASSYNHWLRLTQDKVDSLVLEFLTKNSTDQPRAVQQAKDMFAACMDTKTLDKRRLEPTFAVLKSLGLPQFPTYLNITEDFDYSNYNFNWLDTVIKVKTQLDMDIFIGFIFGFNPTNSSLKTMILEKPMTEETLLRLVSTFHGKGTKLNSLHTSKSSSTYSLGDKSNKSEPATNKRNFLYTEILKLFVRESGLTKGSIPAKTKLLHNIQLAVNTFVSIDNDINNLKNDDDDDNDDNDNTYDDNDDNDNTYDDNNDDDNDNNYDDNGDDDIDHWMTVDELQAYTDKNVILNNATTSPIWRKYLKGLFEISNISLNFDDDRIGVSESNLKYLAQIATYIAKTPPVILELYIWVKVVAVMILNATSGPLRLLDKFSLEGLQHPEPRSLQCAEIVNNKLEMAVTYGITDDHFVDFTKPKVKTMVSDFKSSFAYLIQQAQWIDDDTKLAINQKINEMKSGIGFPSWLFEEGKLDEFYEGIIVKTDTHLENVISVVHANIKKMFNEFRTINDYRDLWSLSKPTIVNAAYAPILNTLYIPLVIIQYPFYNLGLDSLNYGSLGALIGHEIVHGFDSTGRLYDRNGNVLQWWNNETIARFKNKIQCLIDQYNNFYLPEIDEYVNGENTLGDNIADNGGVRVALKALRDRLSKVGPEPKLPGFEQYTPEQMFFLSFGNVWCSTETEDYLKQFVETDHSPNKFRVIGTLQNNEDFSQAWKCPKGTNMNPDKRCIIY